MTSSLKAEQAQSYSLGVTTT